MSPRTAADPSAVPGPTPPASLTVTPNPTAGAPHTSPATPRLGVGALAIAVVSAAAFGLSGPFAKSLLEAGWSPSAAVLARIGGAALVLLPLVVRAVRRRRPTRQDVRMIVMYGVIAVAGTQLAYFSAVQTLSVGVALLLEYLAPVLLVGLAWARTRRAPRPRTLVGAVVSMAGLVLVLDLSGDVPIDPVGVLWGLAAAVGLSAYFLLSARVEASLPPVVLAGGGLVVGTLTMAVLGLVGVVPLEADAGPVTLLGTSVSWIMPVAVLVGVSTVAAYLTGIVAAGRLGSRIASFVGLTEVLFAIAFAWLLLGELPAAIQMLGGIGILVGVALVHGDADKPLAAPDPPPGG